MARKVVRGWQHAGLRWAMNEWIPQAREHARLVEVRRSVLTTLLSREARLALNSWISLIR